MLYRKPAAFGPPPFLEPAQRSTALLRLLEPQERKSAFRPPPDY